MNKAIPWILGILFAAAMGANILWAWHSMHKPEEKPEEKHEEAKRLSHDAEGNPVLKLDAATQERIALKVDELKESTLPEERAAYGRLQEDPAGSFTLRAPLSGLLRKAEGREWPRLGETVADGTVLASLQPRFSASERLDLQSRLTAAQGESSAATASLEAASAAFERTRSLNAADKTASDRALQEAGARMKSEAARLKAATETSKAIEASLGGAAPVALMVERGGEVVEVAGQPGEAIESGQVVLRVARFNSLVARVSQSAGEPAAGDVASARITVLGRDAQVFKGVRMAATSADPQFLGDTFLFRVDAGDHRLRPGMALTALLELPGEARKGVILPRSAIVRQEGELWAYVKTGPDQFTRRELHDPAPVEAGWFVSAGFKAGDALLVVGAQLLLSEELKAKIQGED